MGHCDLMDTFSRNLDTLMTSLGMTNQALGDAAGISRSQVSLIRNGKSGDITFRTAGRIAEALGVTFEDLVKASQGSLSKEKTSAA